MRTPQPNDLRHYWMPFTANRAFKANPRMIVSADGMYYKSADGRAILDAAAGLWCVNAGHNRPSIAAAIQQQLVQLDYAPCFNFGHPQAFVLANRLSALFPDDLNQVFFANSGSEAVDTALKIAIHYHRVRGEASRTRLIGRERAYHGVGFGGTSVGGMVKNRSHFATLLPGVDHLRHTHDLKRNAFSRGCPEHGAELADDLERLVQLHDPSTIAAVIVEPVSGSTGVLLPPKGYLQRLREICTRHGILLIFDEVITGFGRLGRASASEYFGVTPDLMTLAKGLTNAVVPMGAVVSKEEIYKTTMEQASSPIELFHGYTYSGHPLACAAALATLDLYASENLFQRSADLATYWDKAIHSLNGRKNVIDLRVLGLVAGIELTPRPAEAGARGREAMIKAWEKGIMIRVVEDTVALSPPLIITEGEINHLVETLATILESID